MAAKQAAQTASYKSMRRLLNVTRALEFFYELQEAEGAAHLTESEDSDSSGDASSEEEWGNTLHTAPIQASPQGGHQRARSQRERGRCVAPSQAAETPTRCEPWKTEEEADSAPQLNRFRPRRTPGVQLETLLPHTPKELFLLYFATDTVLTLCRNTNKNAAKNQAAGKKYKWEDVGVQDMHKFFGILLYMSLVSLPSLHDYWRQDHVLSVPTPRKVMTRDRFRSIFWNLHMSDPDEDVCNDEKKGTPSHDKLFRVKPLLGDIVLACQACYQPQRELAVDERMVATKARTGITQYMKDKPTKWGIKLFVLAESKSGYTLNFIIYTGERSTVCEHGLAYDTVMDLIRASSLGTGYHIFMDNFYTSPKLFIDLASMNYGACGTYRENRRGFPRGRENALTRQSDRGSVRWIREGKLVFVKWMDTREVSVCSTIHQAHSGETVQRRVKSDGRWDVRVIPCPTPVIAYNKHMGGVDLSDQLIQYYSVHRRTGRWYKTVFLHLLDIATTNAYILHREMSSVQQVQPMSHKDFVVELVCQLCGVDKTGVPTSRSTTHVPVPITTPSHSSNANKGRLRCKLCLEQSLRRDTAWKCQACDVPLCLMLDRNCFAEWHK